MSKFTKALKNTGNGILSGASLILDSTLLTRMTEIEKEIDTLQEEYARINEKLDTSRRRPVPYKK